MALYLRGYNKINATTQDHAVRKQIFSPLSIKVITCVYFIRQQFERLSLDCHLHFSLLYKFIVGPTVGTVIANLVTVGFNNIDFSLIS